jgi:predicted transcriptional regulator
MKCPVCGFENLPGTSVCENCGSPLTYFEKKTPVTKSKIEKAIIKDCLEDIAKESSVALIVSKDMSVKEVIELMNKENQFSAVVMNGDTIEGIFTERSLLWRVCNESPININKPISEAMGENPITLQANDRIVDALHLLDVRGFTYVIINDPPVRVINIRDIFEYLIKLDV